MVQYLLDFFIRTVVRLIWTVGKDKLEIWQFDATVRDHSTTTELRYWFSGFYWLGSLISYKSNS